MEKKVRFVCYEKDIFQIFCVASISDTSQYSHSPMNYELVELGQTILQNITRKQSDDLFYEFSVLLCRWNTTSMQLLSRKHELCTAQSYRDEMQKRKIALFVTLCKYIEQKTQNAS